MDFPTNSMALEQKGQWMFGKSLLVAPVTKAQAKQWTVYLPESSDWYDFWTGESTMVVSISMRSADRHYSIVCESRFIVPFGPKVQYAAEKLG